MAAALPLDSEVLLARLKRARVDAGISQEEAAAALGVARTTLAAIEGGQRRLRAEELLELGRIYDEPLDALLRANPSPRSLAAQFRTAAGRWPEQEDLQASAARLQRLAEDYVELESLTGAPLRVRHPPAHDARDVDHAEWLAEGERGRLGLGDGPLPHLREILENDVGLRIFSLDLPSRVAGLFGYDDVLGACIAMNARQRWERQRWSLAHEYAHFLTRREEVEITVLLAEYRRVPAAERYADTFARHFLLPTGGVLRRFQAAASDADGITPALLLEQSDWWGVSFQAFVLRLESLRLVRVGTFERLSSRGFKVDEGRAALNLPDRPPDVRLLPRRYRLLAVQAFNEGDLSEGRLARFLRVDRLAAREAIAELHQPIDES
jgi:Zn-dependent peptidase ImmA (M78 family)/transcriptional regulator with XRE-family HTH domain